MSARPDLTIVVVTHDGRERALQTVRSLQGATGGAAVELLVVDSGSRDGTPEAIADAWPELAPRRLPNVGFAAANNVALREARGRYVVLVNPDVEITGGTFADLVRALDDRPDVGAASVIQRGTDGLLLPSIRRFPSPGRQLAEAFVPERVRSRAALGEREQGPDCYARERSADWVVGAFLAIRRVALEEIGGLDERFFLYSEETDWCYRLRERGWDVRHLPTMTITHHLGGYERPDLMAQLSYSKLLFASKHLSPARALALRGALACGHAARMVLLVPRLRRPGGRRRWAGEWRALALVLGRGSPPFAPEARSRHAR